MVTKGLLGNQGKCSDCDFFIENFDNNEPQKHYKKTGHHVWIEQVYQYELGEYR